jgi:hypothetical protein
VVVGEDAHLDVKLVEDLSDMLVKGPYILRLVVLPLPLVLLLQLG